MNIVRTFWKSIKDLFEDLFVLGLVNILWALMNAPLAIAIALFLFTGGESIGLVVVLALLGILTFGPANAGLYTIAERVTEGRTSSWRDFIAGVRTNPVLSWKLYGLWMLGLIVILVNLSFYDLGGNAISAFLKVLFLYFLVVWFGLLIYIGPLMLLQADKRIRVIARNAAVMTFGRPLFTLVTLILMAAIVVASLWLPILLMLLTFSFLGVWSFRATLTLVTEADERREALAAKAEAANIRANTDKGRSGQIRPRE